MALHGHIVLLFVQAWTVPVYFLQGQSGPELIDVNMNPTW